MRIPIRSDWQDEKEYLSVLDLAKEMELMGTALQTAIDDAIQALKDEAANADWQTPSYVNGWGPYSSGGHEVGSFYKDPFGRVHLRGLLDHLAAVPSNGEVMFTLPTGYRPLERLVFAALAGGDGAGEGRSQRVDIDASGNVIYLTQGTAGAANIWLNISGISFLAEQ